MPTHSAELLRRWYSRTLLTYALVCVALGLAALATRSTSSPASLSERLLAIHTNVLVFGCSSLAPVYFGWRHLERARVQRLSFAMGFFGLALNITSVCLLIATLAGGRFATDIASYQDLPMLSKRAQWLWGVTMLAAGVGQAFGALACYRTLRESKYSALHNDVHTSLISCACVNSALTAPAQLCLVGVLLTAPNAPDMGLLLEQLYWLPVQPLMINVALPMIGLVCRWLEATAPSLRSYLGSVPHIGVAAAATSWFGWGVHVSAPTIDPLLTAASSAAFMLSLLASIQLGLLALWGTYAAMRTTTIPTGPIAAACLLFIASALGQVPLALPALRLSVLRGPYFLASWYLLAALTVLVFLKVMRIQPGTAQPK